MQIPQITPNVSEQMYIALNHTKFIPPKYKSYRITLNVSYPNANPTESHKCILPNANSNANNLVRQ